MGAGQTSETETLIPVLSHLHRLEMLARQVQFALRSFWRQGGAYALATGILAIGIGLSVAIFSLVEAVVLSPLPFPDQGRIHLIWKSDLQTNEHQVGELAYPELEDLRASLRDVEHVALMPAALYGNARVLQTGTQEPVQIETCPASSDFFRVLGVSPALGRDFTANDEGPGAAPVVMLSDRVWREHFGAKREIVGQLIRLDGIGHTIIGVVAPEVNFPRGAGLWVPLRTDTRRGMTWLVAIARVRFGAPGLRNAAERAFQIQVADYPQVYSRTQHAVVTPVAEYLTGTSKPQLLVSLMASLLLLLSACVSASGLFVSRTLVRRREVATRMALGASRSQILLQFAIEGLVAALVATFAGSFLAAAAIQALVHWAPADIPRIEGAHLDLAALAFAAVAAVLATVACGIGPALLLRGKNLDALLREGGTRTAGSRTGRRIQSVFVFSQSAVTVAILALCLLLFLSYRAMMQTDTGFSHRDTLTMNLALRGPAIDPASRRQFYAQLLERLRAMPEVTSAAAVLLRPLEGPIGWDTEYSFEFDAGTRDTNLLTKANFEVVTPQYFDTVGTALLTGRDFNEHDAENSEKVVIISQSLDGRIRRTGREPIGQRMRVFGKWRKVIGVTADARYRRVVDSADNVYVPYRQVNTPTNYLVIRGRAPST
ncbi:MAG: ABC transporter permease, partial [Bryobacteraceae bacterium]|nr:ABC transporter permease [Bryobacteraceae bacterium]